MKIELDDTDYDRYRIEAYSSAGLVINEALYEGSVVVTPEEIIEDWGPQTFADLAAQHLQVLVDRDPEVLLLGTGAWLRFPDNTVLQPLVSGHVGYEIMDTGAACRAYNFMMGEGRRVIAALLKIEPE